MNQLYHKTMVESNTVEDLQAQARLLKADIQFKKMLQLPRYTVKSWPAHGEYEAMEVHETRR